MFLLTLKAATAAVLLIAGVLGGFALMLPAASPGGGEKPEPPPAAKPAADPVAWGEAVEGLQWGISYRPGDRAVCRTGESVTFVVHLKNVGDKSITVTYLENVFEEFVPTVRDADGKKKTVVTGPMNSGDVPVVKRSLDKGDTIRLGTACLRVVAPETKGVATGPTLVAAGGNYRVSLEGCPIRRAGKDASEMKWNTGSVALEVEGPADAPATKPKGLTLDEAAKRKGETVTVEVRLETASAAWTTAIGAKDYWVVRLKPAKGLSDGSPFELVLTSKAATEFLKAHKDPAAFLRGKTVRLTGKVEAGPDREKKGVTAYRLCVFELKNFEVVE